MILSRELGKRIWGGSTNIENGGGGVSSDAIAGLLTGYAKESWVDEHYISIDFFSRLFQAHGTENGSEIDVMPNDLETTITSVESMFGFWTNLYISALGSNGAAPAGISLGMLTDVVISGTPSAGQVLTFDAATQKWVNGNARLATLTDVLLTSLQNGQTLLYDSINSRWYNSALKTINGQSLLGSGDISVGGGASGNYLPLSGGTLTGALGLNFSSSSAVITINDTKATTSYTIRAYSPNLNTGESVYFDFGKTTSSKNSGHIAFRYLGNSSDSNYITLGLYGVDNQFVLNGAGNVGVGTSSPSTKLNVSGTSGDPTPVVLINGTRIGGYNFILNATVSDLVAGTRSVIFLGKSTTEYNGAVMTYYHAGDGSTSNYLNFGLFGVNNILNIYPTRTVSIVSENQDGALFVENKNSNSGIRGIDIVFNRQPTSGFNAPLIFGVDNSMYNKGTLTFGYRGNGSSSNYVGLGLYANDDIFTVNANGNAGIGTTSPSYKLHVVGDIYATGGVTALSDARHKTIINPTTLQVEQIARMPAVMYQWNDGREDKEMHVGSIAQDWQTVLPEVVMDKGGELSMQYGVAALVSAIITARKVVDHERRIHELEKENERLKEEISQLRLN